MARQFTSLVLFFTPALVLNTLRFVVTPLGKMMSVSPTLDICLHIVAFVIGYVLFRRTRIVRDHEWQRSRAVKSVGSHFKAEDSGVWEKDIAMDGQLTAEGEANPAAVDEEVPEEPATTEAADAGYDINNAFDMCERILPFFCFRERI